MNELNVADVYKAFEIWFSKNLNTSTNKQLAWLCFLAGFLAHISQTMQTNDLLDVRFPVDEARINEREMWCGNRPGG